MHSLKSSALKSLALIAVGLTALAVSATARAGTRTYLSVGDSLAYGYQNDTVTPTGPAGYPGYTAAYDAFLSTQAGTPVSLLDLGIVGETSATLLQTTSDNGLLNSNYTGTTSQFALLTSTLQDSSRTVGTITVQIGANDILGLAASAPFEQAYFSSDQAAQQQLLSAALTTIAGNEDTLLTQITSLAPMARVQVLGYYNPYAALPATNLTNVYLKAVSSALITGFNATFQQAAAAHHAQYIDLATPFAGHEDTLTLSNELIDGTYPNDHPSTAGYAVIASQLEAAPVPETSARVSTGLLLLLGLGGIGLACRRARSGGRHTPKQDFRASLPNFRA